MEYCSVPSKGVYSNSPAKGREEPVLSVRLVSPKLAALYPEDDYFDPSETSFPVFLPIHPALMFDDEF